MALKFLPSIMQIGADPAQQTPAQNQALGISLAILAIGFFGIQDSLNKHLVQTYSPFQIAMIRYWAIGLFAIWWVSRRTPLRRAFQSHYPKMQILRGTLMLMDIWLFSFALKVVPLAELHAITLVYPLLVTVLAALFLGEKVGRLRILAVLFGFGGALIIVRPGGLPLNIGVLYAAGAVLVYSSYLVFTRKVSDRDDASTSLLYMGTVGAVGSTLVGVWFWLPVPFVDLFKFAVMIVMFICAHSLTILSLRFAAASVIQPFNYLALPWAIVLSWVVFGHLIDPVSFIGAVIIVAAGLFVWLRERAKKAGG